MMEKKTVGAIDVETKDAMVWEMSEDLPMAVDNSIETLIHIALEHDSTMGVVKGRA